MAALRPLVPLIEHLVNRCTHEQDEEHDEHDARYVSPVHSLEATTLTNPNLRYKASADS